MLGSLEGLFERPTESITIAFGNRCLTLSAAGNDDEFTAARDKLLASRPTKQRSAETEQDILFNAVILAKLREHPPNSVAELVKCYAECTGRN